MGESNSPVGEMESGVMGAEPVRAALERKRFASFGPTPPVDPSELTFLALDAAVAAARQRSRSDRRASLAPLCQGLAADPTHEYASRADTRSPYTREYPGSEGGNQAHYMVRWLSRRGEPGPWSETASATIGA